jgi:hypothetical protein
MDRLARQLDAAHEAVSGQIAASVRPANAAGVVGAPCGETEKAPLSRAFPGGAGWTRTTDQRIMSPALGTALTCRNS